jgi:membrane-associated phospholipid phosphatase
VARGFRAFDEGKSFGLILEMSNSPTLPHVTITRHAINPRGMRPHIKLALPATLSIGLAFSFDQPVLVWVKFLNDGPWRNVSRAISFWGDFLGVMTFALIAWFVLGKIQKTKLQLHVYQMVACAIISGLAANALRVTCGRQRPTDHQATRWCGPAKGLMSPKYQSFPSAHTAVIAGFTSPLLVLAARNGFKGPWLLAATLAGSSSLCMAWARVRIGQHHPSDVVCSLWLGTFIGIWWMNRSKIYPQSPLPIIKTDNPPQASQTSHSHRTLT